MLAFRIQPDEAIRLSYSVKRPGMQLDLRPVSFVFNSGHAFRTELPDACERLLLDGLRGDATPFVRSDELEAAWDFVRPIQETGRTASPPLSPGYAAGCWGPLEADRLIENRAAAWRRP